VLAACGLPIPATATPGPVQPTPEMPTIEPTWTYPPSPTPPPTLEGKLLAEWNHRKFVPERNFWLVYPDTPPVEALAPSQDHAEMMVYQRGERTVYLIPNGHLSNRALELEQQHILDVTNPENTSVLNKFQAGKVMLGIEGLNPSALVGGWNAGPAVWSLVEKTKDAEPITIADPTIAYSDPLVLSALQGEGFRTIDIALQFVLAFLEAPNGGPVENLEQFNALSEQDSVGTIYTVTDIFMAYDREFSASPDLRSVYEQHLAEVRQTNPDQQDTFAERREWLLAYLRQNVLDYLGASPEARAQQAQDVARIGTEKFVQSNKLSRKFFEVILEQVPADNDLILVYGFLHQEAFEPLLIEQGYQRTQYYPDQNPNPRSEVDGTLARLQPADQTRSRSYRTARRVEAVLSSLTSPFRGGIMPWLRGLVVRLSGGRITPRAYDRFIAFWLENVLSLTAGGLVAAAGAAVLAVATGGAFAFPATAAYFLAWPLFFLLHLVPGREGQRAPPLNLALAGVIAVVNLALVFTPLSWPLLLLSGVLVHLAANVAAAVFFRARALRTWTLPNGERVSLQAADQAFLQQHADEILPLLDPETFGAWNREKLAAGEEGYDGRPHYGKFQHSLAITDSSGRVIALALAYERGWKEYQELGSDSLYLNVLAVAPDYQGLGLGTLLTRSVIERFRRSRFLHFLNRPLAVSLQSHVPEAQRLFERMGFQAVGEKSYPARNLVDRVYLYHETGPAWIDVQQRPRPLGTVLDPAGEKYRQALFALSQQLQRFREIPQASERQDLKLRLVAAQRALPARALTELNAAREGFRAGRLSVEDLAAVFLRTTELGLLGETGAWTRRDGTTLDRREHVLEDARALDALLQGRPVYLGLDPSEAERLNALAMRIRLNPELREDLALALILHDYGFLNGNQDYFHTPEADHAREGAELARPVLAALGLPAARIDFISELIARHDWLSNIADGTNRPTLVSQYGPRLAPAHLRQETADLVRRWQQSGRLARPEAVDALAENYLAALALLGVSDIFGSGDRAVDQGVVQAAVGISGVARLEEAAYRQQIPEGFDPSARVTVAGVAMDVDATLTRNQTLPPEGLNLKQVLRALRAGKRVLLNSGSPMLPAEKVRVYRSEDPGDYEEVTFHYEREALEERIVRVLQAEMIASGDAGKLPNLEVQGISGVEHVTFDAQGQYVYRLDESLTVEPAAQRDIGKALAVGYMQVLGQKRGVDFSAAIAEVRSAKNLPEVLEHFNGAVAGHAQVKFQPFNSEIVLVGEDGQVDCNLALAAAREEIRQQAYAVDEDKYFPSAGMLFLKFSRIKKSSAVAAWMDRGRASGAYLTLGDSATDTFLWEIRRPNFFRVFLGTAQTLRAHPGVVVARSEEGRDNVRQEGTGQALQHFLDAEEQGLAYRDLPYFDNRWSLSDLMSRGLALFPRWQNARAAAFSSRRILLQASRSWLLRLPAFLVTAWILAAEILSPLAGKYTVETYQREGLAVYRFTDLRADTSFDIVPGYAAKIISFKAQGREILHCDSIKASGGIEVMYPYIDRVQGNRFSYQGRTVDLGDDELVRTGLTKKDGSGTVYHGMARRLPWKVEAAGLDRRGIYVRVSLANADQPEIARRFGRGKAFLTYHLSGAELTSDIRLRNRSLASTGSHPWIARGQGAWRLLVPARREVVAENMIPTGERRELAGTPLDLRAFRDSDRNRHAILEGLDRRPNGEAVSYAYNATDGTLVEIAQSEGLPFVVVWDKEEKFFALEPVSSPPDALNDADGRRGLLPITQRNYHARVSYRVRRVDPDQAAALPTENAAVQVRPATPAHAFRALTGYAAGLVSVLGAAAQYGVFRQLGATQPALAPFVTAAGLFFGGLLALGATDFFITAWAVQQVEYEKLLDQRSRTQTVGIFRKFLLWWQALGAVVARANGWRDTAALKILEGHPRYTVARELLEKHEEFPNELAGLIGMHPGVHLALVAGSLLLALMAGVLLASAGWSLTVILLLAGTAGFLLLSEWLRQSQWRTAETEEQVRASLAGYQPNTGVLHSGRKFRLAQKVYHAVRTDPVLRALRTAGGLTVRDVAVRFGLKTRETRQMLDYLSADHGHPEIMGIRRLGTGLYAYQAVRPEADESHRAAAEAVFAVLQRNWGMRFLSRVIGFDAAGLARHLSHTGMTREQAQQALEYLASEKAWGGRLAGVYHRLGFFQYQPLPEYAWGEETPKLARMVHSVIRDRQSLRYRAALGQLTAEDLVRELHFGVQAAQRALAYLVSDQAAGQGLGGISSEVKNGRRIYRWSPGQTETRAEPAPRAPAGAPEKAAGRSGLRFAANETLRGERNWAGKVLDNFLGVVLFGREADPAAHSLSRGLAAGNVPLFRASGSLFAALLGLSWLARRPAAATADQAAELDRVVLAAQVDDVAAAVYARYGAGDFVRPKTELLPLSDLSPWRRLFHLLGHAQRDPQTGEPVIFVPDTLLRGGVRPGLQAELLRLMVVHQLRKFYAQSRRAARLSGSPVRVPIWDRVMSRLRMRSDPRGYLTRVLQGDASPLARELLQQETGRESPAASAFLDWVHHPEPERLEAWVAEMVRSINVSPAPGQSLATLCTLSSRLPALEGIRVGEWLTRPPGTASGAIVLPGILSRPALKSWLRTLEDRLQGLPLKMNPQPLSPRGPRSQRSSARAA